VLSTVKNFRRKYGDFRKKTIGLYKARPMVDFLPSADADGDADG